MEESLFMKRTDWQECPLSDPGPGRWASHYATINPKGDIALTRALHDRLGAPEAFVLLYNAPTHRIGLRPAEPSERNACPAKPRGRHGGRKVKGWPLLREFRLDIPTTVRFHEPYIDDEGVLVLDLRQARPSAASANHRYRGGKPSAAP